MSPSQSSTATLEAPTTGHRDGAFGNARALACRECGHEVDLGPHYACPECFGPLEVAYDFTAVTREVFVQTPRGQIEAALALGATRWEVVRTTVLPFGMSGYISGAMLGLGRALGETIALLIILRGTQTAFGWSLFDGGFTFASKIASAASEFNDQYKAGAYIAAGLVLFILTFVVNSLARAAVSGKDRSAS